MIAVSIESAARWGCPHCGYRFSRTITLHNDSAVEMMCEKCKIVFVLLAGDVETFTIASGVEVRLQPHPRQGLKAHGA